MAKTDKLSRSEKQVARNAKRQEKLQRIYGISEGFEEEDGFRLKIAGIVLKKKWGAVLLMTIIFALGLSAVSYLDGLRQSKAVMMLNYEQSIDGLAPNGTRFNISDFTSDEVMEIVIQKAGLSDLLTVEELKDCLKISAVINKKPTDKENYYIPTSFRITYMNPRIISDIESEEMLGLICSAFDQYFNEQYTMNTQILSGDYDNLDDMEFSQVGSYLSLRIKAISNYLDMRQEESGKFKSEKTEETFNSIKKRIDNLKDYNLGNYNAYIWENGIVKDRTKYVNTLAYFNTENGREKTLNTNEYNIRREVIDNYNSIMSTSILIPTINAKNNFYMARTKTGVDYLATSAGYYLETAMGLGKQIETNGDKLSKIKDETVPAEQEKAKSMIEEMCDELIKIEQLAIQTDKEYNAQRAKNYVTFKVEKIGILSRIPKKLVLFWSFLFMIAVFYIYYKECSIIAKGGARR